MVMEGVKVQVSQQVLEWQREAFAVGFEEGRILAARSAVHSALEIRFGIATPADIAERVETSNDLELLRCWHSSAVVSSDIDAFRAAI